MASASSSRPAASCSPARPRSRANSCSGDGRAGSTNAGSGPGPPSMTRLSVNAIPQTLDDRLKDFDRRLHMLQVVSIAVPRAVIEWLGDLGVARGARVAPVLVKADAGRIKRLADKFEHAANAALLMVDDIFVAYRQVVQRERRPIMLDQFEDPAVVQGRGLQRESAVVAMCQVVRKHRQH